MYLKFLNILKVKALNFTKVLAAEIKMWRVKIRETDHPVTEYYRNNFIYDKLIAYYARKKTPKRFCKKKKKFKQFMNN